MVFDRGRLDPLDGVNHIHPLRHSAKYCIAPAAATLRLEIQKVVVFGVDEKLRAGRVRVSSAGHGQSVFFILEAIVGFIGDGRVSGLLFQARLKSTTLNHEARNDTVKNRAVVVAFARISQKIGGAEGGLDLIEFNVNDAVVGVKLDFFAHDGCGLFKTSDQLFLNAGLFDEDRLGRDVGVHALRARWGGAYFVNDVHARDHSAKNCVAV